MPSTAQDMQTFCLLLYQRQQQQRRKSRKVEIPLGREAGHVHVCCVGVLAGHFRLEAKNRQKPANFSRREAGRRGFGAFRQQTTKPACLLFRFEFFPPYVYSYSSITLSWEKGKANAQSYVAS